MKRFSTFLAVVMTAFACVFAQAGGTGTVQGLVQVQLVSGLGTIGGVTVKSGTLSATSDGNGNFKLPGVPSGIQSLTAAKAGLIGETKNVNVPDGNTTIQNFTMLDHQAPTMGALTMSFPQGSASSTSLVASWGEAKDATGIDYYLIAFREATKSWPTATKVEARKRNQGYFNLKPGTLYQFRMRAFDRAGNGTSSGGSVTWVTVSARTDATPTVVLNTTGPVRGLVPLSFTVKAPAEGKLSVSVDGNPLEDVAFPAPAAGDTDGQEVVVNWDTRGIPNKDYLVKAVETDVRQNTGKTSATLQVANPVDAQLTVKVVETTSLAALPGIQVAIHQGTNAPIVKTTDANGMAKFVNLMAGDYTIAVGTEGYRRVEQSKLIHASDRLAMSFQTNLLSAPRISRIGSVDVSAANPYYICYDTFHGWFWMGSPPNGAQAYDPATGEAVANQFLSTGAVSPTALVPDLSQDRPALFAVKGGDSDWFYWGRGPIAGPDLPMLSVFGQQDRVFGRPMVYVSTDDGLVAIENRQVTNVSIASDAIETSTEGVNGSPFSLFTEVRTNDGAANSFVLQRRNRAAWGTVLASRSLGFRPGPVHYLTGTNLVMVAEGIGTRLRLYRSDDLAPVSSFVMPGTGQVFGLTSMLGRFWALVRSADGSCWLHTYKVE